MQLFFKRLYLFILRERRGDRDTERREEGHEGAGRAEGDLNAGFGMPRKDGRGVN